MMRRRLLRIGGWLLAVVCVLLMSLGALLGELAIRTPRTAVTQPESDEAAAIARAAGPTLETVEIERGAGVRLRAWFIDAGSPAAPTVLVTHGVTANRGDTLGLMRLFSSQGMAVLAPDARGHGESGGTVSYGVRERADLFDWILFLARRRPSTCVVGVGVSLGAAELLQALSRPQSSLCGIVAEASFSSFREVAYDRVGQCVGYGPWLGRWVLRPAVEAAFLWVRMRSGDDLRRATPVEAIRGARIPILLIHGTADHNIPPRHVQALAAANRAAQVWMIPNAGHYGAWAAAPTEYPRRLLAFVRDASVPR
jgi:pimeloyl-ACP methyl ester carboxylesterase